jgi:hypothetical protein
MHTIYTKIAVKIRILTSWDQKEFLVKISATDLIQELPSELSSIDRMFEICKAMNRNRNKTENLFFFFF